MIGILIAAALASTDTPSAPRPPNPCDPKESCRFVPSFDLRAATGTVHIKVDDWVPYVSDGAVLLFPGERVTVELQPDAAGALSPTLVSTEAAPDLKESDQEMVERSVQLEQSGKETRLTSPLRHVDPPPTEAVRLTFEQVTGHPDMILMVENGYGGVMDYQAGMAHRGQFTPTTVCLVTPHHPSFETWAEPFIEIRLSDFRFVTPDPAKAGSLAECD